jgi:hypothetical protein
VLIAERKALRFWGPSVLVNSGGSGEAHVPAPALPFTCAKKVGGAIVEYQQ